MIKTKDTALRIYQRLVLDHPVLIMVCIVLIVAVLGYHAKDFHIDASAESILLENDQDLHYSRQVTQRYSADNFLLIAFLPKNGDLLADHNLAAIGHLRDEVAQLPQVSSVMTILDVPLFSSPPIKYSELADGLPTLMSPKTDKAMARIELRDSAFYRDLLVSTDMSATAIVINLKPDPVFRKMINQRNSIFELREKEGLSNEKVVELELLNDQIRAHLADSAKIQHDNISTIRTIIKKYKDVADLYLGGVDMIQDDMITFVRNDLMNFGIGVFLILVVMLGIIFRRIRWIVLPMLSCLFAVTSMLGILGIFGWDVTVISSNFISLQLIITLAIVVHLIVRYREYMAEMPDADHRTLVKKTIRTKFIPCLYAALTTIAGFVSLLLCNIKPVINFGWMMAFGIIVSLLMTFVLFPAFLMLLKKEPAPENDKRIKINLPPYLARFTEHHGTSILIATIVLIILTATGLHQLRVENSFIDYFKKSTEIYRGMALIDRKLGGTTPLDVVVGFKPVDLSTFADMDDEEDDLLNPYAAETQESYDQYWFFEDRMHTIEQVHDYLEALPETGKVLSMGTLLKIARTLNDGQALDSIEMAVLYTKLPAEYKDLILKPYLSIENDETRFSVRVIDSMKSLQRDGLLKKIKADLTEQLGIPPEKVHLTGTMVLYNNMLQSLFSSQIKTIGVVVGALLIMFLILFRSIKMALIALFPNLFSVGVVLSAMGWLGIPLDMMTITIASISIGIAVDDTIHYIYRFREEIKNDGDYINTMHRCHRSIGYAMFYTSITIVIGFSIMAFSNFWPTIYFGLFTGLAMVIALLTAMTLLPWMIVRFKPFGPSKG